MDKAIRLDEDWHVSSTFSFGTGTVEENVSAAEAVGLKKLCLVDRARRSSGWVGDLVETCRGVGSETAVKVECGVEVEVLDTTGALALPKAVARVDHLYVATRSLPTPSGPLSPAEARAQITAGTLLPARAIEWLVRAWAGAAKRANPVVIAAPFDILSEIGVDARFIHPSYVHWLVRAIADKGASVELSESRRCLSPGIVGCLIKARIPIRVASGGDSPEAVGRYYWCRDIATELAGVAPLEEPGEPLALVSW